MKKILFNVCLVIISGYCKLNAQTQSAVPAINMGTATQVISCLAQFYDSGGLSGIYQNSEQDTLTILPGIPGRKVCVTFHAFNTEESNDYLDIHNGNSIASPVIAHLSGGIKYGTIRSSAIDGSLTFVFHSNNINNNFPGWNATINTDTIPEDITMIASDITWHTSSGRFFDGGGPNNNYENNAQTTTTIYPLNSTDKLNITFHYCSIAAGDLLYVFNGNNSSGTPIAAITGGYNFGTITSTASDGSLTFVFTSSVSGTAEGWNASISVNLNPEDITPLADGIFTVSQGRFFDSGGEFQDYPNNKTATVTMLPQNAGNKVCVTFHECLIAAGDYLEVYDGDNTSGPLLAALTGYNYGTVKSTAASGALTFRFVTGISGTAFGWDASITTDTMAEDATMMSNGSYTVGKMGRFYDNGGPANYYGDNQHVVTTLNPANPGDKVSVTFHLFAIQAGDNLYVYDGADTTAAFIGSYSGALNAFTITSTTGSLTFKFVSNASSTNYGWFASTTCTSGLLSYNMTPNTTNTYTTNEAFFYDDGGPNADYSSNLLQFPGSIITFKPVDSLVDKISVSFSYFATYNSGDYLEIYDGANQFAPLVIKLYDYAGYGTITATNAGGSLTFKFVSDGGWVSGGWAAHITTNTAPKNISMPGIYTTNSGFYYDAGGPAANYTNSIDAVTTIKPVGGIGKISLSFTYFSTYNPNDYIVVHDGTSVTDSIIAILNSGSGYGTVRASSANSSGSLTLRFVSDGGWTSFGWAAIISNNAVPKNVALPGTYIMNSGFYYDPGGPFWDYTNNINSVTTIKPVNSTDKISISFNNFSNYGTNDYLEIHDGENITDPILTILSSYVGYGTITASPSNLTGSLTIRFVSDGGWTSSGWVGVISTAAQPKNISLPGAYVTNTGFLFDAGGPDLGYNNNVNDIITIKPSLPGTQTTVAFNYFDSYGTNDYLQVFSGDNIGGTLIATLSGAIEDTAFTSMAPSGALTFQFISDAGWTSSGWAAAITNDPSCMGDSLPNGIQDEPFLESHANIYPNPSHDNVTIEYPNILNEAVEFTLSDALGKKLLKQQLKEQKSTVSLNYPGGIYLVTLSNSKNSTTQKLIIQNR